MTRQKKAAPVDQTGSGGEQTRLDGFDELPMYDFITNFSPAQGSVAFLLSKGRENALTTRELCKITGQKPREITRRICTERRMGAPILSDPGAGFWIASDADELHRCTAGLHRRAGEIHRTARALENCAKGGREA